MSSSELQRELVGLLKAQATLVEGRVYDAPPPDAQMPYISLGPNYSTADEAECSDGWVEVTQIDVWGSALPNRAQVKNIVNQVVRILRGHRIPEDGLIKAGPFRVTQFRVLSDPDPEIAHGVILFEVFIEDG